MRRRRLRRRKCSCELQKALCSYDSKCVLVLRPQSWSGHVSSTKCEWSRRWENLQVLFALQPLLTTRTCWATPSRVLDVIRHVRQEAKRISTVKRRTCGAYRRLEPFSYNALREGWALWAILTLLSVECHKFSTFWIEVCCGHRRAQIHTFWFALQSPDITWLPSLRR